MNSILKCPNCKKYGLSEKCDCGNNRISPKPPKYSPEDKYAKYRRKAYENKNNKKGKSKK